MRYRSPVLRGFRPDSNICKTEEDFYMATSSFIYRPGVPVFHSRNLMDWSSVGHRPTGDSQVQLEERRSSRGIFVLTLRHHESRFCMATTNVDGVRNFIVHSPSIGGPWSGLVVIGQNDIDPSLFQDKDGTCWYCERGSLEGKRGIIAFVSDPPTGETPSNKYAISKGCGGKCTEGPHTYKKDGWYYLLTMEGGMRYSHGAVIQRFRNLISGYKPCLHNPLLSHQEENWKVVRVAGHRDLAQNQYGDRQTVYLGIRMFGDYLLHNLDREAFLVPVVWRDGRPVMGKNGRVELMVDSKTERMMDGPPGTERDEMCATESGGDGTGTARVEETKAEETKAEETRSEETESEGITREQWELDFRTDRIPGDLWYIHNPHLHCYEIRGRCLAFRGNDTGPDNATGSPTYILRERREFVIDTCSCVDLEDYGQGRFEMTAYYNSRNHYDMAAVKDKTGRRLTPYKHIHDLGAVTGEIRLDREREKLWLGARADKEEYYFDYSLNSRDWTEPDRGAIAGLYAETIMERSYTETMVGLFVEHGQGVLEEGLLVTSEWMKGEMIHGIPR